LNSVVDLPVQVLAIDPGLSGAAALVGRGDILVLRDFKTYRALAETVCALLNVKEPEHLLVELVGARPGEGVVSMFHFGEATGVGLGALMSLRPGMVVERVHPLKWKNFYRRRLVIPKGQPVDSRVIATTLFPASAKFFKRQKDHNSADAVLMAVWKLHQL